MFSRLAPPTAARIAIRNTQRKQTKKPQPPRKGQATMSVIAWPHFTGSDPLYKLANPFRAQSPASGPLLQGDPQTATGVSCIPAPRIPDHPDAEQIARSAGQGQRINRVG